MISCVAAIGMPNLTWQDIEKKHCENHEKLP